MMLSGHCLNRTQRRRFRGSAMSLQSPADATLRCSATLRVGGLHTEAAVFDNDKLFIGSMNFDPRSERYNTETGLFIHSAEIAREATRLATIAQQQASRRLRLTPSGQIQRLMPGVATDEVHVEEPEAGFWVRMLRRLVAPLVPEVLL